MFEYLKKLWNERSSGGRIGIVAGVSVIIILTALFAWWALGTNYAVLFKDLDPQDAAAVTKALKQQKISYKLANGGSEILVDRDHVYQTRINLLGNGLQLNHNVGFEIFDRSDIGMTEFAQKVNFQRALQGELARTIESIRAVRFARVHLVLASTSLFRRKENTPKAGVSLVMKTGRSLTPKQVLGIQRLVAASVRGLKPDTVTITDQDGDTLSQSGTGASEASAEDTRLDMKRRVEKLLTQKAMAMLDRAYGKNKAIISVDATLDMDHVKRTTETVVPVDVVDGRSKGLVVRRQVTVDRQPNPIRTASNGKAIHMRGGGIRTNSTSEVVYKYGKSIEQFVSTPGSIKRISVSVIVPGDVGPKAIAGMKNIISMAVGLDPKRGDGIAVYPIKTFVKRAAAITRARTAPAPEKHGMVVAGSSVHVKAPPVSGWRGLVALVRENISRYSLAVAGVAVGLLLLAILALVGWIRSGGKRGQPQPGLGADEREHLLAEITRWLNETRPEGEHGT